MNRVLTLLTRTGIVWPVPAAGPAPSAVKLPGHDHGPRTAIQRARNLARSAPAGTCARNDPPGEWRLNSRRESGGCHVIASHIPIQAPSRPGRHRGRSGPGGAGRLGDGKHGRALRRHHLGGDAGSWPAGQAGDFPRPGPRRRDADDELPCRTPLRRRCCVPLTAIQQLDEGAVQAACSCGWRSPVSGAGKRTGTTGPLQHATEAAALHEWEMSLQLAAPHVRRDVTAVALTAYSGIPDQQHRGPRRRPTWPQWPAASYGWAKKDRIAGATISGLPPRLAGPTSAEPP